MLRTNKQGAAMLRRLAKGVRIVRANGLMEVGGNWVVQSDTGRLHLVNGACDCTDYEQRQQFNGGWCKHRLAVYLAQQMETSEKPLETWLRTAVSSVIKKHPADATNTGGGCDKYENHPNTTTQSDEGQRYAVGCWRYFDGCACNICEAADRRRQLAIAPRCQVCNANLDAQNIAEDDMCWRCAQDRDYAEDQAMYHSLANGF